MCGTLLEKLKDKHSVELVKLLNSDPTLKKILGYSDKPVSEKEFIAVGKRWRKRIKSMMFGIIYDSKTIGMISLSHIDRVSRTAGIGYWIGSDYWNRGIASSAFKQILEIARSNGIVTVSAKIAYDNIPSLRLWERYDATKRIYDDKLFEVSLKLDQI